jgi:ABC-type lipoprotein release transport system permease subunit
LVAALVGMLALATLAHALIILLHRHTGDLAVLAALGMTNRQRRGVGIGAGIVIVAGSIVIGVPIGLIVGRWVWQVVAERIFIPSGPVMPWGPTVAAPLIALAVAVCVAAMATLRSTRRAPASALHTE